MTTEPNNESEERSIQSDDSIFGLEIFGHVMVTITAEIGHADLSIESILSIQPGDSVKLSQNIDDPITLFIDEKPIAKGKLVSIDDNFGIQITEVGSIA